MKVDVLLGLQWGDEGKGKVVDVLTPKYDVVARFQGGPNAGHTLEFEGQKYVLRSIPSGIFQGNKVNIIGNGVVLDPALFKAEAEALEASGHPLKERLHISKKAHLILPTHRILDAAYEAAKGDAKVGTTGKGIGPTYTDKISRNGVRVGDILHDFDKNYAAAKARHEQILKGLNYEYDITEMEKAWFEGIEYLKQFQLVDSEHEMNNLLAAGKSVLCEGAQGTMLDIDFGSEYDAAGNGRQRHRKAQLQQSIIRQRLRHGKHLFAHTGIKAEHEGGVQCPTHGLYAQKDAAQHIQHRIGDPHKGADAQSRKAGGQNDGKTGGAAKYKVVGRTVKVQCYCIDDKSQIQQ